MKYRNWPKSLGLAFIVLFLGARLGHAVVIDFKASLDGAQVVPSVVTPATGSATGTLSGNFGSNDFVFAYSITYSGLTAGISNPNGGRIQNAPAGFNGPVAHFLDTVPFNYLGTTAGTITGAWRFDDATFPLTEVLAQEMIDGDIYIILGTDSHPAGEIRGQLLVPEPATLALFAFGLAGLGFMRRRRSNV